jgi:transcriptional regulator with XRE-family HTH domain
VRREKRGGATKYDLPHAGQYSWRVRTRAPQCGHSRSGAFGVAAKIARTCSRVRARAAAARSSLGGGSFGLPIVQYSYHMEAAGDLSAVATRVAREIRAHREARGLSLSATAARAGLSKTILATIESGTGNPSLETLCRLAGALDVTVGTLLAEDDPLPTQVTRRDDGEWLAFESGVEGRLIHVDGRDRRLETLEIRLEPGRKYLSRAHQPGTEELVICVHGALVVGPEGREEHLAEGDALHFAADVPHSYRSKDGCLALCSFTYPAVRGQ